MGRAQAAAFSPQLQLRSGGSYASGESWQGGDDGETNSHIFRSQRSSLPPVSSCTVVAYPMQLHNINRPLLSVFVHAVLGGGAPRQQPLNGTDRHALQARRQSESVLAGGNGGGGIQLRPDSGRGRPLAGKQLAAATAEQCQFQRQRILNFFCSYVLFVVFSYLAFSYQ
jgi:hypothetical protein